MRKPLLSAAALLSAVSVAAPAWAGGNSIAAVQPTTGSVYFTVTVGGNNDSAEIGVSCDSGYATRLTVVLDASGAGTSQTIYPPPGTCTADLELGKQIGRFHVLATTSFTVT